MCDNFVKCQLIFTTLATLERLKFSTKPKTNISHLTLTLVLHYLKTVQKL